MSSEDWKIVSINDLCEYISRGVTPVYTDKNGVHILNQKCIRENRVSYQQARLTDPTMKSIPDVKYLRNNDILVNSTGVGTLGRVAQVKEIAEKTTVDSHITIVRARGNVNARFLGYNLFMQQPNIEALAEGSTGQTELSRIRLAETIKVLLPTPREQQVIADTLSCIDEKIDVNRKINENLFELAFSLYEHKLQTCKDRLMSVTIDEICDVKGGKRLPKGVNLITTPNSHPYIRVRDLNNSYIVQLIEAFEYVDDETQKNISRYIVNTSDVLISIVGTIGLTAIVHPSLDKANLTENCVKLTNLHKVSSEFLFLFLRSKEGRNSIEKGTVGAVQAKLPIKNIKTIPLFLLPEIEMVELDQQIVPIFQIISDNMTENTILVNIRESLLPKLMSGELSVCGS